MWEGMPYMRLHLWRYVKRSSTSGDVFTLPVNHSHLRPLCFQIETPQHRQVMKAYICATFTINTLLPGNKCAHRDWHNTHLSRHTPRLLQSFYSLMLSIKETVSSKSDSTHICLWSPKVSATSRETRKQPTVRPGVKIQQQKMCHLRLLRTQQNICHFYFLLIYTWQILCTKPQGVVGFLSPLQCNLMYGDILESVSSRCPRWNHIWKRMKNKENTLSVCFLMRFKSEQSLCQTSFFVILVCQGSAVRQEKLSNFCGPRSAY